MVVDPSGSATDVRLELAARGARCAAILVTHGHFDHILGLADLAEGTGAPVYAPASERALLESPAGFTPPGVTIRPWTPDVLLEGGESLELANIRIEVLSVPGHSPGHQSFEVTVSSGDTFILAVDAADTLDHLEERVTPGTLIDAIEVQRSVRKLRRLAWRSQATVIAGHDPAQCATLRHAPEYYA